MRPKWTVMIFSIEYDPLDLFFKIVAFVYFITLIVSLPPINSIQSRGSSNFFYHLIYSGE